MHFALLVSQLPRVEEARTHYNDMLSLDAGSHASTGVVAAIWTALKQLAR
ncbi:hypothetical protein M3I53_31325 [Paraburkholderia sp. CNPSo 3272]|nr:hypothetical protein [Paraburkholderia sp. CNPSo 3272]MCP3727559.1 hypothetical protein [Paraburkholderia sp. CNPSo 3272]